MHLLRRVRGGMRTAGAAARRAAGAVVAGGARLAGLPAPAGSGLPELPRRLRRGRDPLHARHPACTRDRQRALHRLRRLRGHVPNRGDQPAAATGAAGGMSDPRPVRDELHIASLVVQHREDAVPALQALVAQSSGLEIALGDATRSVLLQETRGTRELMDSVDRLRELPGVLNVNLVYHHAEARQDLEQPLQTETGAGT